MHACMRVYTQSGPCQPHHHSWRSVLVHSIDCKDGFTHVVLQVARGDGHGGLFTTHNAERHFTENLTEGEEGCVNLLPLTSDQIKGRPKHCFDWPVKPEEGQTAVYLFHLFLQVSDPRLSAVLSDEEAKGVR